MCVFSICLYPEKRRLLVNKKFFISHSSFNSQGVKFADNFEMRIIFCSTLQVQWF